MHIKNLMSGSHVSILLLYHGLFYFIRPRPSWSGGRRQLLPIHPHSVSVVLSFALPSHTHSSFHFFSPNSSLLHTIMFSLKFHSLAFRRRKGKVQQARFRRRKIEGGKGKANTHQPPQIKDSRRSNSLPSKRIFSVEANNQFS